MCDGDNHYLGFAWQMENVEREPLKNELARTVVG